MVNKLISSKTVVAKVYRDLDIRDASWESNAIEWVGECLRLLDTWVEYYMATKELTVSSFKALLPDYYHATVDVWRKHPDDNRWVPIVYNFEDSEAAIIDYPEEERPWSYWLNLDTIVTTFEDGTLLLRYYRQCVDDNGYPMIPDNQNFQEACLYYILYKMFLRKYKHPDPNVNITWAYQMYEKYIGQARAEIKFPTIGELEELVRNWTGISVEETDYKLWQSSVAGNGVFPGFGYIDYQTGELIRAETTPEYMITTNA